MNKSCFELMMSFASNKVAYLRANGHSQQVPEDVKINLIGDSAEDICLSDQSAPNGRHH
jgi:hypothetical protein